MKTKIYLLIALITISMFASNESKAAFLMKKAVKKTITADQPQKADMAAISTSAGSSLTSMTSESKVTTSKHSFLSRISNFITKGKHAVIPQILYIILAILPLGWLAMGINDNFQPWDWVISLILYCILWLPGIIYTLIKMNKYY